MSHEIRFLDTDTIRRLCYRVQDRSDVQVMVGARPDRRSTEDERRKHNEQNQDVCPWCRLERQQRQSRDAASIGTTKAREWDE